MPLLSAEDPIMTQQLPTEVVSHIMGFLNVSDRKEAALVNQIWYNASLDPLLLRDTLVTLPAETSAVDALPMLGRRKTPHLVLENIDGSHTCRNVISQSIEYLSCHLESLSLKGSEITESMFVCLLSKCHHLVSLDISCCNSLFMCGTFLSKEHNVALLKSSLNNVTELNMSSIRHLSDSSFNRMMAVCSNVKKLGLAGTQIVFHTESYCDVVKPRAGPHSALFTFLNLLEVLGQSQGKITVLNLSRTSINDECLDELAHVHELRLKELHLVTCKELTDHGFIKLVAKQSSLQVLNLESTYVTDSAVTEICTKLPGLINLNLSQCTMVSDLSVKTMRSLRQLQTLSVASCFNVTRAGLIVGLCNSPMEHLSSLNISCCSSIRDDFFIHGTKSLKTLTVLDASTTGITDLSLIMIFKDLGQLRTLKVAWCRNITDDGLLGLISEENIMDEDEEPCSCTRTVQKPHIFKKPAKYCDKPKRIKELEWLVQEKCGKHIYPVTCLKHLQHLDLTACGRITNQSLVQLHFSALRCLLLTMCPRIRDESLASLAQKVPSLEELHVSQCPNITDEGVVRITAGLRRLNTLNVSGCDGITNNSIVALQLNSKHLHHLDVSMCSKITQKAIDNLEASYTNLKTCQSRLVGDATA